MREINSHVFLVKHQGSTIPRRGETFLQTGPLCSQILSDCFLEQVFEFMTPASHFSPIITVSDWMASSPRLCLCLLAAHGRTLSFHDPGYFFQATECGAHSCLLASAEAHCVSCMGTFAVSLTETQATPVRKAPSLGL